MTEKEVIEAYITKGGEIFYMNLDVVSKRWGYADDLSRILDAFVNAYDLAVIGIIEIPGAARARLWGWRAPPNEEEEREILSIADADLAVGEKLAKLYDAIKKVLQRYEREDPDLGTLSEFSILCVYDGWDMFVYVVRTKKQRIHTRLYWKLRREGTDIHSVL